MRSPSPITSSLLAVALSVVLGGCGVMKTAKRTAHSAAHGIGNVATYPITVVRRLYGDRKPGKADYGYTVRGKRYHVMTHAEAHHYSEIGIASFYGSEGGSRTASGERFNPLGMTAAHKTLPLNSHVKVTNLNNGKSVVVRINDRGPFVSGRVIDVSKGAANKLDFRGSGVTRVRVEAANG